MNLHKSQVLLILLVSFFVGVFWGQFMNPPTARILLYSSAIVSIVLITVFWGEKRFLLAAGIILVFAFGGWRLQSATPPINESHIAFYNDQQKVVLVGVVVEEPDVREKKTNLTIKTLSLCRSELDLRSTAPSRDFNFRQNGGESKVREGGKSRGCGQVVGKILVSVGRYPEYQYGDMLEIVGKLETPFETEDFSYKNYLAKDQIYSVVKFAKVDLIKTGQGNWLKSALLRLKSSFASALSRVIPEPQNSLLLGLLVGARQSIPQDLLAMFKLTGVTHIIAISGFNISIITRILGSFIQRHLGLRAALVISVLAVVGFVIITGAPASVVRAAVMGVLVVVAMNIGRVSLMLNTLVLTAGIMVLISPQILMFDIGFQLSFLATAGLIAFADSFEKVFRHAPEFFEIRASLAATLSAQIFVLPLLVYYFDQLSVVAPLVNVLILPLIPWAMFFGFLSGVLATVWLPISYVTAWITWAFLSYQIAVVEFFAKVPHAAVGVKNFSLSWVLIYYLLLLAIVFVVSKRKKEQRIWRFQNPQAV